MKYLYKKETIKKTKIQLEAFYEFVSMMDKGTLHQIVNNMFDGSNIHFDDLIRVKSPSFEERLGGGNNTISEASKYSYDRERRIEFIKLIIYAIFELQDGNDNIHFKAITYRYIYGYTIRTIADILDKDESCIKRVINDSLISLAPYVSTEVFL